MKKLIMFIILLVIGDHAYSQRPNYRYRERNSLNLRIGPEIGFAAGSMNNTQNFGTGGSALLDLPVHTRFSLLFYAGFISFSGDVIPNTEGIKYRRANMFPLRGGVNYRLTPTFYTTAQLGHASVKYLGAKDGGVSQSLGIGYFNRSVDIGARWDHHYVHGGLSSINAKIAFVLRVGRRR